MYDMQKKMVSSTDDYEQLLEKLQQKGKYNCTVIP